MAGKLYAALPVMSIHPGIHVTRCIVSLPDMRSNTSLFVVLSRKPARA